MKVTGKDVNNFPERMPVVRHIVSGVDPGDMIKEIGKILTSVFLLLRIIKIFHANLHSVI